MRLKHKPKQGEVFSMWGKDFIIIGVCPMRSWIDIKNPTTGTFRISTFLARKHNS